jgi:hypothetical protein
MVSAVEHEIFDDEYRLVPVYRDQFANRDTLTSAQYFFLQYGAEFMTFEVGDNNSAELLRRKGEVSATCFMEVMLEN